MIWECQPTRHCNFARPICGILRRMVDVPQIQHLAEHIADCFRPEQIILFGSYAYGSPTDDSDVDLLVVMPARNEVDLRVEWRRGKADGREFHVGADVFNLTNQSRATSVETLVGDQLGEPANVSLPRSIRLGIGVSW